MNEERAVAVKKHIENLRKVMRFYHPDGVAELGKHVDPDGIMGALAEALTRIDELSDRLKAVENWQKIIWKCCEPKMLDERTLPMQKFGGQVVPATQMHEMIVKKEPEPLPIGKTTLDHLADLKKKESKI